MRGLRVLGAAYVAVSLLASVVMADPGPTALAMPVYPRQADETETTKPAPKQTATTDEPEETGNANDDEPSETKKDSKATTTDKEDDPKETGKGKSTSTARTKKPNRNDPAGGIKILKPITTDGSIYYKFGEKITFEWNMTSVQVTPPNINVEAYFTPNSQVYTISANMSAQATKVVWDTGDRSGRLPGNDGVNLVQGQYALHIYDASQPKSAVPSAGHLGAFQQLRFAMYKPAEATPYAEFKCVGCKKRGAGSTLDRGAAKVLMFTSFVAMASFMWFLGVGMF